MIAKYFIIISMLYLFIACKDNIDNPQDLTTINDSDWELVAVSGKSLRCFTFDAQGKMFIALGNKILHSKNDLNNWDTLKLPNSINSQSPISADKLFITENGNIIVAYYTGFHHLIIYSTDNGKNWLQPSNFRGTEIRNISGKNNRIYISSSGHDESTAYIQISDDSGLNWRTALNYGTGGSFSFCEEVNSGTVYSFGYKSNNGHLFHYSYDLGNTWQTCSINFKIPYVASFASYNDNKIFIGNDGGIYFSTDEGFIWQTIKEDDNSIDYYKLINDQHGNIYSFLIYRNALIDRLKEVSISTDGGLKWSSFSINLDLYYDNVLIGKDGYLYAAGKKDGQSGLYRIRQKIIDRLSK